MSKFRATSQGIMKSFHEYNFHALNTIFTPTDIRVRRNKTMRRGLICQGDSDNIITRAAVSAVFNQVLTIIFEATKNNRMKCTLNAGYKLELNNQLKHLKLLISTIALVQIRPRHIIPNRAMSTNCIIFII